MVMKQVQLTVMGAALAALALHAAPAGAQQRAGTGGLRIATPTTGHFSWEKGVGFKGGLGGGIWIVEREVPVVIEREVMREVPVPVAPDLPPEPRKPYVIGASYASLPSPCMKMIEDRASYYYCSGEWYRQVGTQYRAVAKP